MSLVVLGGSGAGIFLIIALVMIARSKSKNALDLEVTEPTKVIEKTDDSIENNYEENAHPSKITQDSPEIKTDNNPTKSVQNPQSNINQQKPTTQKQDLKPTSKKQFPQRKKILEKDANKLVKNLVSAQKIKREIQPVQTAINKFSDAIEELDPILIYKTNDSVNSAKSFFKKQLPRLKKLRSSITNPGAKKLVGDIIDSSVDIVKNKNFKDFEGFKSKIKQTRDGLNGFMKSVTEVSNKAAQNLKDAKVFIKDNKIISRTALAGITAIIAVNALTSKSNVNASMVIPANYKPVNSYEYVIDNVPDNSLLNGIQLDNPDLFDSSNDEKSVVSTSLSDHDIDSEIDIENFDYKKLLESLEYEKINIDSSFDKAEFLKILKSNGFDLSDDEFKVLLGVSEKEAGLKWNPLLNKIKKGKISTEIKNIESMLKYGKIGLNDFEDKLVDKLLESIHKVLNDNNATELDYYKWTQDVLKVFEVLKANHTSLKLAESTGLFDKILNKLKHNPNTFGLFQVNVDRLIDNLSINDLPKELLDKKGKIDRNKLVFALSGDQNNISKADMMDIIIKYHLSKYIKAHDLNSPADFKFLAAETNSGFMSTYKAAIQEKLNLELGTNLLIDGDLSNFHENTSKIDWSKTSNTQNALYKFIIENPEKFQHENPRELIKELCEADSKDKLMNSKLYKILMENELGKRTIPKIKSDLYKLTVDDYTKEVFKFAGLDIDDFEDDDTNEALDSIIIEISTTQAVEMEKNKSVKLVDSKGRPIIYKITDTFNFKNKADKKSSVKDFIALHGNGYDYDNPSDERVTISALYTLQESGEAAFLIGKSGAIYQFFDMDLGKGALNSDKVYEAGLGKSFNKKSIAIEVALKAEKRLNNNDKLITTGVEDPNQKQIDAINLLVKHINKQMENSLEFFSSYDPVKGLQDVHIDDFSDEIRKKIGMKSKADIAKLMDKFGKLSKPLTAEDYKGSELTLDHPELIDNLVKQSIERLYVEDSDESKVHVIYDGRSQTAFIVKNHQIIGDYSISTGKDGFGNNEYQTPIGLMKVYKINGEDTKLPIGRHIGKNFSMEKNVKIYKNHLSREKQKNEKIFGNLVTRWIGFQGMEKFNVGETPDQKKHLSNFASHGTNLEGNIGEKDSGGCVRQNNKDIITVAGLLEVGSKGFVIPDTPKLIAKLNFNLDNNSPATAFASLK